jgi:hypothetical protein
MNSPFYLIRYKGAPHAICDTRVRSVYRELTKSLGVFIRESESEFDHSRTSQGDYTWEPIA